MKEEIRYWVIKHQLFNGWLYLINVLLVPYSLPTVLLEMVVLEDELLEAKVCMEGEVVRQVRGGECVPVQYEGLAGHELHELLAEVPDKPLLQEGHHQAPLWGQVQSSNSFLQVYDKIW